MAEERLQRSSPLAEQLLEILRQRIRSDTYPAGHQLPSESELSQEFGVSRATVRSALSILAARGYIVRRPGVGTYVSQIGQITNPINRAMEFHEMIASCGFEPGVHVDGAILLEADPNTSERLCVDEGSQLIRLKKVFTADGDPIVSVITLIPAWVLGSSLQRALDSPEITEPLFTFLEETCNQHIGNLVAVLWPETVGGYGLDIESLDPTTPVLIMDYVAYSNEGTPIFQSIQAYLGNRMRFTLIRQREEGLPPQR